MSNLLVVLISLCLFLVNDVASSSDLPSVFGKTIIPIDARTPQLNCGPEILGSFFKNEDAESEFFIGQYRDFRKSNLDSADIEYGLNFIFRGNSSCSEGMYNSYMMTEVDERDSKISFIVSGIDGKDLSRDEDKYDSLRQSRDTEVSALASLASLSCPWDRIESISGLQKQVQLDCRVIEKLEKIEVKDEKAEVDTEEFSYFKNILLNVKKGFFGDEKVESSNEELKGKMKNAGEKSVEPSPFSNDSQEVADYYGQFLDFTLLQGKGWGTDRLAEPVEVEKYLVCSSPDKEYLLSFAVMSDWMRGLKYMCK